MNDLAASIQIATSHPRRLEAKLRTVAHRVRPVAGLLFVTGKLTSEVSRIAEMAAAELPGAALLVVPGSGILGPEGEVEGESAVSGVFWSQGRAEVIAVSPQVTSADAASLALAGELEQRFRATPRALALTFLRTDRFHPGILEPWGSLACDQGQLLGGGTLAGVSPATVSASGEARVGTGVALLLNLPLPLVGHASACRGVTAPMPITEVDGSMVLRVGDRPALEVLSDAGGRESGQPLILATLRPDGCVPSALLSRPVLGVDPLRGGVLLGEDVRDMVELGFAVRDAAYSRSELSLKLRELSRALAGSAPLFGVYLNCSGRGSKLYGAQSTDYRAIRERFPSMPVAGVQSPFQVVTLGGKPRVQLYDGSLALFRMPS